MQKKTYNPGHQHSQSPELGVGFTPKHRIPITWGSPGYGPEVGRQLEAQMGGPPGTAAVFSKVNDQ